MKYCVSAAEFVSTPEIDRIGTLRYSRFGLIALFGILYVGVFAMAGANLVIPNLVPLFLKGWNLSNAVIGILIGTIPAVINVMVNPVVSVASDRVRTRFGRRSPFMYIGVPGVSVTLIVMGILTWAAPALVRSITGLLTPGQLIVAVMAFLMIWFQVFSNLGLSIFYYFCTDVVPGRLIGKFMAIFMLFNSAGGFSFSYVMMPLAERYMPLVFILEGMFLLAAFLMIFLFVREGRYPVPAKKKGISGEAWRFLKECFGSRFYLLVFLGFAINDVSTLCRGFFSAFYAQELGISLTEYGRILSICSLICAGLTIPLGLVIDRIKPFRVYIWGGGFDCHHQHGRFSHRQGCRNLHADRSGQCRRLHASDGESAAVVCLVIPQGTIRAVQRGQCDFLHGAHGSFQLLRRGVHRSDGALPLYVSLGRRVHCRRTGRPRHRLRGVAPGSAKRSATSFHHRSSATTTGTERR